MKKHFMKFIPFFVLALGIALAGSTPASHAQEFKIGFVDMAAVVDGYHKTKAYDAEFKKKYEQKEAEIESKTQSLRELEESLELLAPDAREQRLRDIQTKRDEIKRLTTFANRDLQAEKRKLLGTVLQDVEAAVQAYGERNGFTLLLDDAAVLYGFEALNVTQDVINTLNSGQ